jgi:hypothetical protein
MAPRLEAVEVAPDDRVLERIIATRMVGLIPGAREARDLLLVLRPVLAMPFHAAFPARPRLGGPVDLRDHSWVRPDSAGAR